VKAVQAAHHGAEQSHVDRVVIHGTVSPCKAGGALAVARFFARPATQASAHYVVDPADVVRCLPETIVGWHAPPNAHSIGVELCDPQKGDDDRWHDDAHTAMLELAATLVRQIAARWKVPLLRIDALDLRHGQRGICGHVDVSQAWHESDHTDPGKGFPWAHFMDLVRGGQPVVTDHAAPAWPGRLLKYPPVMRGDDVRDWQRQMVKLGYEMDVDGAYGPDSRTVCRAFQRHAHLDDDGAVGRDTWDAAFKKTSTGG
jgi:N-acetyl-anhydromuramyl-L-alanine amidase AmpD